MRGAGTDGLCRGSCRQCHSTALGLTTLLKPGGRLLVGNYLRPSPASRHQPHHRAMMELYSDWHLRYRDVDQIRAFTTDIDRPHTLEQVDETGHQLRSAEESVIGFAVVQAR